MTQFGDLALNVPSSNEWISLKVSAEWDFSSHGLVIQLVNQISCDHNMSVDFQPANVDFFERNLNEKVGLQNKSKCAGV